MRGANQSRDQSLLSNSRLSKNVSRFAMI